jgi:hypothetical protein
MSPLFWLRLPSFSWPSPGSLKLYSRSYSGSQPGPTLARRDPSWKRWLRYLYLRLLRLQSSPKEIARGLAVGVFAGCFPIFGFQTLAALVLAVPFRGNKLAAAAGTWVSNPFTYVPIYAFNYQVGEWLLGSRTVLPPQSWWRPPGKLDAVGLGDVGHAVCRLCVCRFLGIPRQLFSGAVVGAADSSAAENGRQGSVNGRKAIQNPN